MVHRHTSYVFTVTVKQLYRCITTVKQLPEVVMKYSEALTLQISGCTSIVEDKLSSWCRHTLAALHSCWCKAFHSVIIARVSQVMRLKHQQIPALWTPRDPPRPPPPSTPVTLCPLML